MKNQKSLLPVYLLSVLLLIVSCKKDDPVIPNEEELITTLVYTLTPVAGGEPAVFTFTDTDGAGGAAPVVVNDTLTANTAYLGSLQLLDETVSPPDDISAEITDEAEAHQFFFAAEAGLNATVTYADFDGNGRPLGLANTLTTGNVSEGGLTITLRHEPDKAAAGVADGNIANAGGETDIEVQFTVKVQ
ncbi:type 1 periplasmic binding fold superfamily protein [Sphingobacteriales bacterium UPWRP_1]|nr:hypothetical protein B6N25_13240 [Sphingobacteriales bacterium TSM_CSS]PSJ76944.1 type 1 periplasmic binding fold superfamily protein [Sphingobacteriales bacterium UPWRP_1]